MIVLHICTGKEAELRERLMKYIPLLPMEMQYMRRQGVWVKEAKVLMPGYLFLDTELSDADYYRVKEAPSVLRVMNYGDPLPGDEAENIRKMAAAMMEPHEIDNDGSVVRGYFDTADLIAVHKRQRRAVFSIRLMGRRQTVTVSAVFL